MIRCAVIGQDGACLAIVMADPARFAAPDGCDFIALDGGIEADVGWKWAPMLGAFILPPDEPAP